MLLFSRVVTLKGGPRKVLGWATKMTELVNEHSDLDVSLWIANFGYPVGTLGWSARVESRAHLASQMQSLLSHDDYLDQAEQAADMVVTQPVDYLGQLIHGEPASEPPPLGAAAGVITAVPANGRIQDAVQWGIETSDYVGSLTGVSPLFMADAYGTFGQLTWILGFADMAAADAAADLMFTDGGYMDRIKAASDLFNPGSGHQGLITRIA